MKKHALKLSDKENRKLQEIKKDFRSDNLNDTIRELIRRYKKWKHKS